MGLYLDLGVLDVMLVEDCTEKILGTVQLVTLRTLFVGNLEVNILLAYCLSQKGKKTVCLPESTSTLLCSFHNLFIARLDFDLFLVDTS